MDASLLGHGMGAIDSCRHANSRLPKVRSTCYKQRPKWNTKYQNNEERYQNQNPWIHHVAPPRDAVPSSLCSRESGARSSDQKGLTEPWSVVGDANLGGGIIFGLRTLKGIRYHPNIFQNLPGSKTQENEGIFSVRRSGNPMSSGAEKLIR